MLRVTVGDGVHNKGGRTLQKEAEEKGEAVFDEITAKQLRGREGMEDVRKQQDAVPG